MEQFGQYKYIFTAKTLVKIKNKTLEQYYNLIFRK